MGYVMPAETLTLLEGYEEDADAAERAAAAAVAPAAALDAAASGVALPLALGQPSVHVPAAMAVASGAAPAAAREAGSDGTAAGAIPVSAAAPAASGSPTQLEAAAAAAAPPDPAAQRFRRQMQEAYLRTQQLRTMIEWGRAAMGKYHPAGCEPADEVSVLIWPGGAIEHWPRGTTVGKVAAAKVGLLI